MFFNEFEKYEDAKLNKNLLWEYKVDNDFDILGIKKSYNIKINRQFKICKC